jgi:hypothetical protein
VNCGKLLDTPLTVTATGPVVAPLGTGATMDVVPQVVGLAGVPLNVTVLLLCAPPKLLPVIVTDAPTGPEGGAKLIMPGVVVKLTPLLGTLFTITNTFPVVAVGGTGTTIELSLQLVGVATPRLKITELLPWAGPKLVPVIVTEVPCVPVDGLTLVIVGTTVVNGTWLLFWPF